MNLWLEQSAKAAHCARTMSRIAIQYAREGDPMMAFAKRREARWWLRKARDYRANSRPQTERHDR